MLSASLLLSLSMLSATNVYADYSERTTQRVSETKKMSSSSSSSSSIEDLELETDDEGYIIEEEIEETYVIEELGESVKSAVSEASSVEKIEDPVTINLKDVGIRFATNSAMLDSIAHARVQRIASILAVHPSLWTRLCLEGHTDERASHSYNMSLSQRRVQTVNSIFIASGLPMAKLCTRAFGETRPIDPRHNIYAWEKNRRVELKLYGIEEGTPLATALLQLFHGNAGKIPSRLVVRHTRQLPPKRVIIKSASSQSNVPVLIREGETFTINLYQAGVHFAFDKDTLRSRSRSKVREIGRLLRSNLSQWKSLALSGHTDSRGSNEYNMDLAKRRTQTVGKLLLSQGLPLKRLSARAYGENKPAIDRATPRAWAKNRRVEMRLTGVPENSRLARKLEAYFKR